jgi:hypothetical protein
VIRDGNPTSRAADPPTLHVSRTQVRRGLLLAVALLLTASTLVKSFNVAWGNDYIFGLLRLLWVDQEGNLPTWFSSTLLLAGAILAIIIAKTTRDDGRPHVSWHLVAGLLLVLAIDEVAGMHEILASYSRRAGGFGFFPENGLTFGWVLLAMPPVIVVCWLAARFFRTLAGPVRNRLGAGLAIFLAGALGVEALTGQIVGLDTSNWLYLVFSTIEEGAEMIGVVVFLDGLLGHLETSVGAIPLQFAERGKSGVEGVRGAA